VLLAKRRRSCGPSGLGSPPERVACRSGPDLSDLPSSPSSEFLCTDPVGRPLRRASLRASAPGDPSPEITFHPRGFAPPRWFPPPGGSQACFIPLPVVRFVVFRDVRHSSRRCSHPSKNLPHRSRTTSLWPLPPCRRLLPLPHLSLVPLPVPGFDGHSAGSSTSRLCSAVRSGFDPRPLPVANRPVLPWALFPFEVLPRAFRHPCLLARLPHRCGKLRSFRIRFRGADPLSHPFGGDSGVAPVPPDGWAGASRRIIVR